MAWEKINEMFPHGFAPTNMGLIPIEEIIDSNFNRLNLTVEHPCHDIIKSTEEVIWYENGDL